MKIRICKINYLKNYRLTRYFDLYFQLYSFFHERIKFRHPRYECQRSSKMLSWLDSEVSGFTFTPGVPCKSKFSEFPSRSEALIEILPFLPIKRGKIGLKILREKSC